MKRNYHDLKKHHTLQIAWVYAILASLWLFQRINYPAYLIATAAWVIAMSCVYFRFHVDDRGLKAGTITALLISLLFQENGAGTVTAFILASVPVFSALFTWSRKISFRELWKKLKERGKHYFQSLWSRDKKENLLCFIGAAALTAAFRDYHSVSALGKYYPYPVILFVLFNFVLIRRYRIRCSWKENRKDLFFSVVLAFAFFFGSKVDISKSVFLNIVPSDLLHFLAVWAACFLILSLVTRWFLNKEHRPFSRPDLSSEAIWKYASVYYFCSWIPVLMAFYPGTISNDSMVIIKEILEVSSLTNQQPFLYYLLVRPFFELGSAFGWSNSLCAALYLGFQVVLLSAVCGYLTAWMSRHGASRPAVILTALYFGVTPVFSYYASVMWKDSIFALLMAVLFCNLADIVRTKGKWLERKRNLFWFVFLNLVISLLRSNGFYLCAAELIVLLIVYFHQVRKMVLAALASAVALVPIITGPVYSGLGLQKTHFAEAAAVPLQQISYVTVKGEYLSREQQEFLDQIIPSDRIRKVYDPFVADQVKFDESFDNEFLDANRGQFLKVWAELLKEYPADYIKAYAMLTIGYWHPLTENRIAYFGITSSEASSYGIVPDGNDLFHLSGNRAVIRHSFDLFQLRLIPFVFFMNIGCLFWTVMYLFHLCLRKNRKEAGLVFLPHFLLWATLMAAVPVFCDFRYLYPYAAVLPIAAFFAFSGKTAGETTLW